MTIAILTLACAPVLPVFWLAITQDSRPHGPGCGCNGCTARAERRRRAVWP